MFMIQKKRKKEKKRKKNLQSGWVKSGSSGIGVVSVEGMLDGVVFFYGLCCAIECPPKTYMPEIFGGYGFEVSQVHTCDTSGLGLLYSC